MLLLVVGALLIIRDAERLVLRPVERMMKKARSTAPTANVASCAACAWTKAPLGCRWGSGAQVLFWLLCCCR